MRRAWMVAGLVLTVAGCAGLQAHDTPGTERLLAEAGFEIKPADTPEKLAHLQTLTTGKLIRHERNGEPYFVFADPTGCRCLYAGAQPQYEKYRALVRQRTGADEAAVVTQDASDYRLWGLGPWP